MSRCFPFPPPGYEKKTRTDDAELLKKEKQRERKHKKEKRDKEKRESKEKREKDRSDGKHREKKDRKEKHKEKKKDRDKDREKNSTSEEKRVSRQFEGYNGEKFQQKEERDTQKSSTSEKRVSGQLEGSNGEKLHPKEEWGKDKSSSSVEKKPAVQVQGHNGEKPIRNSLQVEETEDSKFVLELCRRIRDEEKGTASQSVEGFTGTDLKKDEGIESSAVRDTGMLAEGREKNKDRRIDNRKIDGQTIRDEARFSGNAMVQNPAGMVENKFEGMPKPMERKIERRMEGKEKSKEREGGDKGGDKHKNKDRTKQSQGKDRDKEKEKKKEEKAKEKSEDKKTEKDKIKHTNKNDLIGALNDKSSHLSKDCDKIAATEGNHKKRKEIESNGFFHDNEQRPNKMSRPSSHLLTDNGKKLEPYRTPIPFTSDRQGAANNLKLDNKEHKVNGTIVSQPLPNPPAKPSSAVAEASTKPPHPDTKYLSRVLSVPKMDEWSDFDDQEWLFSSKDSPLKKPNMGSDGVNTEPQVWAEAMQIESAEVCALPYVIPY